MDEDRKHEFDMARARFKESHCVLCRNVGVLKASIDSVGTLVLCDCEVGLRQPWELPIVDKSLPHKHLKWEDFHPGIHAKSLDPKDMESFIPERVKWWLTKIRIAESFHKSRGAGDVQTTQVQSQTS